MKILGGLSVLVLLIFLALGFYLKNNADRAESTAQNQNTFPLSSKTIKIEGLSFVPNEVKIAKGGKILFINHDKIVHRVISTDASFDTQEIKNKESRLVKFPEAGRYSYYSKQFPYIKGVVYVE